MTSPTIEQIRETARASLNELKEIRLTIDQDASIKQFVAVATQVGDLDHYKFFPDAARQIVRDVHLKLGDSDSRAFLRLVLLQAVFDLSESGKLTTLPPKVSEYQLRHLQRIAGDTCLEDDWLDISHDIFHKEFGLVSLRLFAAGSQLVDIRCGIPRSIIFKGEASGFPKRLITFAKLGGFKPYLQIHTHKFNLDQFHESGWEECYRCCAELYQLFPNILGMFGASWFYDPALETISPRLAYLRTTPLSGGAKLMFFTTGGDAIGNSLSTSASRRELYEAGKYMPKNYMLIWGKNEQTAWANSSQLKPK